MATELPRKKFTPRPSPEPNEPEAAAVPGEKCPKCGAEPHCVWDGLWACCSYKFGQQSPQCRIRELEQTVAKLTSERDMAVADNDAFLQAADAIEALTDYETQEHAEAIKDLRKWIKKPHPGEALCKRVRQLERKRDEEKAAAERQYDMAVEQVARCGAAEVERDALRDRVQRLERVAEHVRNLDLAQALAELDAAGDKP